MRFCRADIDVDTTQYWILDTRGQENVNAHDPDLYTMQYKLPDGVNCPNGCMLQWTWWTANACVQECEGGKAVCGRYAEGFNDIVFTDGERARDLCEFGKNPPPGELPQIFQNCVDIIITPGSGGPSAPATTDSPPATVEESDMFEEEADAPAPVEEEEEEAPAPAPEPEDEAAAPPADEDVNAEGVAEVVGNAGNMMKCDNEGVVEELMMINSLREENGLGAIECDDKATGAAVLWAETECQEYVFFRPCNCRGPFFVYLRG